MAGWVAGSAMLAGCGSATDVNVRAHLDQVTYDELRVGIFLVTPDDDVAGAPTIVDPDTQGRVPGASDGGDAQAMFLLDDGLAGQRIRCDVVALQHGQVVARGDRLATVAANAVTPVDVFVAPEIKSDPAPAPPAGTLVQ